MKNSFEVLDLNAGHFNLKHFWETLSCWTPIKARQTRHKWNQLFQSFLQLTHENLFNNNMELYMNKQAFFATLFGGVVFTGCATQSSHNFQAFKATDLNELVRSGQLVQKTT
jgi:hypothetical protein